MFHSVLWWMLSSFVAQGAFLKVSAKQWMLDCVGQLDDFCDLSFSESFLHLTQLWLGWCFPGVSNSCVYWCLIRSRHTLLSYHLERVHK